MKMKMDLEAQDVKSIQGQCDPVRATKLLYANAHKRLERLLEPYLHQVKGAAETYIQLELLDEKETEKPCDIQSTNTISELLSRMSTRSAWRNTTFLQQAIDAIPAMASEREIADGILSHYSNHLHVYETSTRLKDDLARKHESDSEDEGKRMEVSRNLVPVEITSSKSFAKFTCQECCQLQVRILSAAFGIPGEAIICHDAAERQSTTVIFLVPNGSIYAVMQRTTQLETVWVLLELDVIEVAIPGFTFKPTVGCFLALLRGSKRFTADLLGVTEVRLAVNGRVE